MSLKQVKLAALAAAAALTLTALASGDASAQAFNVNNFSCSDTPFGVDIDVSGLGNTDICVIGDTDVALNCACAGGGGNCTSDAKKNTESATASTAQEVESKNGRAIATVTVPFSTNDAQCEAALDCPSGQDAKLVSFDASTVFQLCTSDGASPCGCARELDTITCTSSGTPFPGKKGSCAALF
jgi:Flp pilus assembly secretin CpaC